MLLAVVGECNNKLIKEKTLQRLNQWHNKTVHTGLNQSNERAHMKYTPIAVTPFMAFRSVCTCTVVACGRERGDGQFRKEHHAKNDRGGTHIAHVE